MKVFARKQLWLLAIPFLLVSFGLWRVQEARSWVPRSAPVFLNAPSLSEISETPIVWRANGLWLLHYDSIAISGSPSPAPRLNWNSAPVALHFPDGDPNARKAVGAEGREIFKVKQERLELWRVGKKEYAKTIDFSPPSAVAISPDGSRWAVASGTSNFSMPPEDKEVFSADGVSLWDAQNKTQFARLYAKLGNVTALAFSPDSQMLAAVAADGWAFVWNAEDGKLVRKWRAHPWVAATVAWSPDGKTLVTGANPRLGQAGMWRISVVNGGSVSSGISPMTSTITSDSRKLKLKVDAQNNLTINSQTDRSLRLWDVKSGQLLHKWESQTGVCSAQFSPGGSELAIGTHGEALIMDAANLKIKRRLPMKDYPKWPASVAWAPDGDTLAVACAPELSLWRAH